MPSSFSNHQKSAHVLADYFLLKVNVSAGDTISNLKLQKLCYFAQAASLVFLDERLFDDEIEAWAHGPVVRNLYKRFKKYSWQAIDTSDLKRRYAHKLSKDEVNLVDIIWSELSCHSAKKLEVMSHEEGGPWHKKYVSSEIGGRCENVICIRSIEEFYSSTHKPKWFEQIGKSYHKRYSS